MATRFIHAIAFYAIYTKVAVRTDNQSMTNIKVKKQYKVT